MRILIPTCNHYLPALRPLAHLLHKYWQPTPGVVVGGFDPPDLDLPGNFTFISLGRQEDYPIGKWSDQLIKLVEAVDDEVFILMLEDMWPVKEVDAEAVKILYDYMVQFQYVARMDLTSDRQFAGGVTDYGNVGRLELVKSDPDSQYHLSLMPGIWNKRHFLSVIEPDESPWDVEIKGTPRLSRLSKKHGTLVLGVKSCPYSCTLAFRGGESKKLIGEIPFKLNEEDRAELSELGLLKPWE